MSSRASGGLGYATGRAEKPAPSRRTCLGTTAARAQSAARGRDERMRGLEAKEMWTGLHGDVPAAKESG
ncbi:hypothetical protein [Streptomyces sp. NPDC056682]|uniref:hypothetical protein n=1 Tax=Streptomyces sp. NPDC056682 TaxID=3345909 RepID=UPI0036BCBAE3